MSDQENGNQGGILKVLLPILGIVVLGALIWLGTGWMKSATAKAAEAEIKKLCEEAGDGSQAVLTRDTTSNQVKAAVLTLVKPGTIEKVLPQVAKLHYLTSLNVSELPITDDMLAQVKDLKLTSLYANKTQITNAGLKHVGGMTTLQSLHVAGTKITEAGLEEIATLKNLTNLNISQNTLNGDLAPLAELDQLVWLLIYESELSDEALETISGIESLNRLTLFETKLNPEALDKLTGMDVEYRPPGTAAPDRTAEEAPPEDEATETSP